MTEMAEVKKEDPKQGVKRPAPTENHVFEEEELPIFSKKPKVMYKNPRKKNQLSQKATNGLDSTPKEEMPTDPGCSFSPTPYPPVPSCCDQKKPKLNYRQLTFLAMKNSNYIPMQTGQICDFIEKVFSYFAQQDRRSKLVWKNALTNAVRTGKCDEGLFTTSSVTGSGLRMFYGMRTDRVEQLEEQVKKWRKQFNKDNFKDSGASSYDELDALCNGTMGAESVLGNVSVHIERWKKSQLSGSTLEDYDAQERQRAQIKINETDPDKLVLTESEERALAKVATRNISIVCSICDAKMNTKSFGRHMKGVHGMSQENLLRHRLELQNQRSQRQEGFEPDPILCPKCGKQVTSNVMLVVHEQECDGTVRPGQEGSEGSYEDGEDYDQEYMKEEEYDDLNLL